MDPLKQDDKVSTKPHPPRKNPAQPHSVNGRPPRKLSTRADPKDDPPSSSSNRSRTTPSRQPPLARSSTSLSHHRPRASESSIPSPAANRLRRSTSSLSSSSRGDIVGSPRGSYIPRLKSATPSTAVKTAKSQPQPPPKRDIYTQRPKKVERPRASAATAQTPPEDPDMRRPMDLKAAFELAQQQEAQANMSSDDSFDLGRAFQQATAEMNGRIDGSPSPAPRAFRGNREQVNQSPFSHLQRFDSDHKVGRNSGPLNGLFGKSKENIDPEPQLWPAFDYAPPSHYPGADEPLPSIEYETANSIQDGEIPPPTNMSPEKSMNWHLDADFTAGDLQVSDSPRVRTAKSTGIDDELILDSPDTGTPGFRRSNNKLDRLREREAEVAKLSLAELDPASVQRHNTKLDEIRASEHENFFSKRAIASSKLDEIRLRNSQARSVSPETPRYVTKTVHHQAPEAPDGTSPSGDIRSKSVSPTPEQNAAKTSAATVTEKPTSESFLDGESQDLLRRLARATSSTPQPRKTSIKTEDPMPSDSVPVKNESDGVDDVAQNKIPAQSEDATIKDEAAQSEEPRPREQSKTRAFREERRSRNFEIKGLKDRPTVGFAGLRRTQSTDSLTDKRLSMANSDIDTTARFDAEMRLFAPRDDYSEMGSVRASSPVLSELFEEETPKPKRTDPLLLPTPRVTGAYIETPATLRVKGEESDDKVASDSLLSVPKTSSWFSAIGSRRLGRSGRGDGAGSETQGTSKARSSSAPAARRPRSVAPRRPQVNTAKPPSVKEDLRAILQSNQIEDSTLDSFDHILNNHKVEPGELEESVSHELREVARNLNYPGASERSLEDLEAYERMSKSVRGGLSGISSAKQGIDRLVDQVSAKGKPIPATKEPEYPIKLEKADSLQPQLKPLPAAAPVQIINWSTVFSINPYFKTKFGLLSKILIFWLALESIFAYCYAPPQYECFTKADCDWSPNEPYFPYAMPFMLDEWSTGGKGRALARSAGQQFGDVVADVSDWATATDFTQLDQRYMNARERKQHRRRLRKHGLGPTWVEPAQYQPRYAEWQASQAAREDAGIQYDDEFMSADETIM